MTHELTGVDVCHDCYFAHHYGATRIERPATDAEQAMLQHPKIYERALMGLRDIGIFPDGRFLVEEWFAGESDTRCEGGEPLSRLDGLELSDWTYDESDPENADQIAEHGDGHTTFTWSACQGCGVKLGGSRERLAIWHKEEK